MQTLRSWVQAQVAAKLMFFCAKSCGSPSKGSLLVFKISAICLDHFMGFFGNLIPTSFRTGIDGPLITAFLAVPVQKASSDGFLNLQMIFNSVIVIVKPYIERKAKMFYNLK